MKTSSVCLSIGNNLPDPFFDSYHEEMCTCCDIIEMVDSSKVQMVSIVIDKDLLKNMARSRMNVIRVLEKAMR